MTRPLHTIDVRMPAEWHEQTERELDHAYHAGYVRGRADADADLVAVMAEALGNTVDYGTAVTRHHAQQDAAARRAASDRGELVEETWATIQATSEQLCSAAGARAEVWRREPPAWGEHVADWCCVERDVSPSVWARIWADLNDRTRRQCRGLNPRRQATR